jgi:hypothetical protein
MFSNAILYCIIMYSKLIPLSAAASIALGFSERISLLGLAKVGFVSTAATIISIFHGKFYRKYVRHKMIFIFIMFLTDNIYSDFITGIEDKLYNVNKYNDELVWERYTLIYLYVTLFLTFFYGIYLKHDLYRAYGLYVLVQLSSIKALPFFALANYAVDCIDPLCNSCLSTNKEICVKCDNISMCTTKTIFINNKFEEQRFCKSNCTSNHYLLEMDFEKYCCEPCNERCLDG